MSVKTLTEKQKQAYRNLNIPESNRIVLAMDGGGIRGILTLQLLKKIEEIAGMPCYEFCDLIAGTSTGAIIAGLISAKKTAAEIEQLYIQLVTKVFLKRSLLASRFLNPPAYDKRNYRTTLKSLVGDLTMEQACDQTGIDLFITAKDVTDNEETFFTCFNIDGVRKGTYRTSLLRSVMEATMSAPTYFNPLERFIDGGTTTYNNPSMAALLEALRYDGRGKYVREELTMFSLGTGRTVRSVSPKDALNPKGLDVYFWLNYVMDESSQDASSMQIDTLRSGLINIDYRRYQISFDTAAIGKLPNQDISDLHVVNADWLHDLTNEELNGIEMDDVNSFGIVKAIGEAMVNYIMQHNKFTRDLNDTPTRRDELITAFGDIAKIKAQMQNPDWLDKKIVT